MNNAPRNIEEFATAAVASARKVGTGLALINRAHAQFVTDYSSNATLEQFKRWLWVAALDGLVQLASHDMPQLLDPAERAAAVIEQGASTFHFVRV